MTCDIVSNIRYWTILNDIVQYYLKLPNIVEYCPILSNIVQYCSILFNRLFQLLSELWYCREHWDIVQCRLILHNIFRHWQILPRIYQLRAPCLDIFQFQIGYRCSIIKSVCTTSRLILVIAVGTKCTITMNSYN